MKRRSRRRLPKGEMLAIRTVSVADDPAAAFARHTDGHTVWADSATSLREAPRLTSTVTADVCVIGLGAAGLSAAIHLADNGASVVGIDAGDVGGAASTRSAGLWTAGLAVFHHDAIELLGRRRATALYQATREELAALHATGSNEQRWPGSVRIAANPIEERDCARQLEIMRRDGLPVEEYDGVEGRGLLFPEDGTFHPIERIRGLVDRAAELGVQLYSHTEAQHVGDRDIEGADGEVRCRAVIVAVDGNLEQIVPALDGVVRTGRVHALATKPLALDAQATGSGELGFVPPPPLPPELPTGQPAGPPSELPPPPGQPSDETTSVEGRGTSVRPNDPPDSLLRPFPTAPHAEPSTTAGSVDTDLSPDVNSGTVGDPAAPSSDIAEVDLPPPPTTPPASPVIARSAARRPVRARWGHDAWQQLPDGRVVIVGGRDHDEDPWSTQHSPSASVVSRLTDTVAEQWGEPVEVSHQWVSLSGFTRDRLPVLARLGTNTIAIGGYSGSGDLLAILLGRAAADLTMGRDAAFADLLLND